MVVLGFILLFFIEKGTVDSSGINLSDDFVVNVIDGDTFETYNGEIIRLICINSPEVGEEGYEEAKSYLEELVLGKEVRLEKDISETDKYGRLLRYVYVNESLGELDENISEEIFVNKEIVESGYTNIMKIEPDVALCEKI